MNYEWDENKRIANAVKHNVDFWMLNVLISLRKANNRERKYYEEKT